MVALGIREGQGELRHFARWRFTGFVIATTPMGAYGSVSPNEERDAMSLGMLQ